MYRDKKVKTNASWKGIAERYERKKNERRGRATKKHSIERVSRETRGMPTPVAWLDTWRMLLLREVTEAEAKKKLPRLEPAIVCNRSATSNRIGLGATLDGVSSTTFFFFIYFICKRKRYYVNGLHKAAKFRQERNLNNSEISKMYGILITLWRQWLAEW